MRDYESCIEELTDAVQRNKEAGRRYVYAIAWVITNETAHRIKQHFDGLGMPVELKKCASCTNNWDIIINL